MSTPRLNMIHINMVMCCPALGPTKFECRHILGTDYLSVLNIKQRMTAYFSVQSPLKTFLSPTSNIITSLTIPKRLNLWKSVKSPFFLNCLQVNYLHKRVDLAATSLNCYFFICWSVLLQFFGVLVQSVEIVSWISSWQPLSERFKHRAKS